MHHFYTIFTENYGAVEVVDTIPENSLYRGTQNHCGEGKCINCDSTTCSARGMSFDLYATKNGDGDVVAVANIG